MVDRCPAKILETVHIFFVRGGQRTGRDILDNGVGPLQSPLLLDRLLPDEHSEHLR